MLVITKSGLVIELNLNLLVTQLMENLQIKKKHIQVSR